MFPRILWLPSINQIHFRRGLASENRIVKAGSQLLTLFKSKDNKMTKKRRPCKSSQAHSAYAGHWESVYTNPAYDACYRGTIREDFCCCFGTECCYEHSGLKLIVLLLQPPKCWGDSCVASWHSYPKTLIDSNKNQSKIVTRNMVLTYCFTELLFSRHHAVCCDCILSFKPVNSALSGRCYALRGSLWSWGVSFLNPKSSSSWQVGLIVLTLTLIVLCHGYR